MGSPICEYTKGEKINKDLIKKIGRQEEIGWFVSDQCFTLGMVGTVIGFILMMSSFGSINVEDVRTVQDAIVSMGSGMATALYTTLVGLVCGILLKMQYFNLGLAVEEARDKAGLKSE